MANEFVEMKTTMGDVKIELYSDLMPETAGNFSKLVKKGFYDKLVFHRVIDGFMIQGGCPNGTGVGGPGYTIKDEFPSKAEGVNKNKRATLSMANAGPNTGGSQFFINLVDNNFLDGKHPVFGKVVAGMDVVDKIAKAKTDHQDRPKEDIAMLKLTVTKK